MVQKLKWHRDDLLLVDQREVHEEERARMRAGDWLRGRLFGVRICGGLNINKN